MKKMFYVEMKNAQGEYEIWTAADLQSLNDLMAKTIDEEPERLIGSICLESRGNS